MDERLSLPSVFWGVSLLGGVTQYLNGDPIQDKATGQTYTVDYVMICGHRMDIATREGAILKHGKYRKLEKIEVQWTT